MTDVSFSARNNFSFPESFGGFHFAKMFMYFLSHFCSHILRFLGMSVKECQKSQCNSVFLQSLLQISPSSNMKSCWFFRTSREEKRKKFFSFFSALHSFLPGSTAGALIESGSWLPEEESFKLGKSTNILILPVLHLSVKILPKEIPQFQEEISSLLLLSKSLSLVSLSHRPIWSMPSPSSQVFVQTIRP